ncbi:MAG: hypothetical protein ACR2PO_17920 [Methyloligellaceae bacterium]
MKRTLGICVLAIGLFGLGSAAPQPAEASKHWRCWGFSATARGLSEAAAGARAERVLKRRVRRWGRQKGYTPRTGPVDTACKKLPGIRYECVASARVCK